MRESLKFFIRTIWEAMTSMGTSGLKAVPLQSRSGPEGSRKLWFPDFIATAQDGGKVVSLTQRPHLPHRKYTWYSFLLEAESNPRSIVRPEGLRYWKIPTTPSRIETECTLSILSLLTWWDPNMHRILWTHLYKRAWRWPVYRSKHVAYGIISSTNFNAQFYLFINNMFVTLLS